MWISRIVGFDHGEVDIVPHYSLKILFLNLDTVLPDSQDILATTRDKFN